MKIADIIDFTKDKINILGQYMDIKFTSSGHYLVPISKSYEALNEFDENSTKNILLSIENVSNRTLREKQSIAEELHKQFGQANSNNTLKLIKLPGIVDKELVDLINEVGEKCTVYLKYKKAPLKPVVDFSLSRNFNDVISMDLKEINDFKILHLIDHVTRYGAPNEILSDNGGSLTIIYFVIVRSTECIY